MEASYSRNQLEAEIEKAAAARDYKRAAQLQDYIEALGDAGGGDGPAEQEANDDVVSPFLI